MTTPLRSWRTGDKRSAQSNPKPVAGSNFVLYADMIVKSLGQEALLELLQAMPGLQIEGGKVREVRPGIRVYF